jgi:hypothetical protein
VSIRKKLMILCWLACGIFITISNLFVFGIMKTVKLMSKHNDNNDNENNENENNGNDISDISAYENKKKQNSEFSMLIENVLLNDVVWVPEQSMIVFLACRPDLFSRFSRNALLANVMADDKLVQIGGVRSEDLQSPLTLEKGLTLTMMTTHYFSPSTTTLIELT